MTLHPSGGTIADGKDVTAYTYGVGAIHDDLIHAGRIDGCGTFRLFWSIGLPIMTPGLAFLAIHTFMTAWNDFLWPLIVLSDQKNFTVQVALGQLQGMHTRTDYGAVTCGALLATLPLIVLFLACGRFFIAGIASGSIKDRGAAALYKAFRLLYNKS